MQAITSGKRSVTALNDLCAAMNTSYRGLQYKTFQEILKSSFRPATSAVAKKVFAATVAAVRNVRKETNPSFLENIIVAYDGTWTMTHSHSSPVGIGTVVEFYTGLDVDSIVLVNWCHGCALHLKEGEEGYSEWNK